MFKSMQKVMSTAVVALMLVAGPAFAGGEVEPNDSYQVANTLTVGEVAYGRISTSSDADYFMFAAPVSGTINTLFLPQSWETADFSYFIWDMTTWELLISANERNPGQYEFRQFQAAAGHVYLIGIVADRPSDSIYQFLPFY